MIGYFTKKKLIVNQSLSTQVQEFFFYQAMKVKSFNCKKKYFNAFSLKIWTFSIKSKVSSVLKIKKQNLKTKF